LRGSVPVRAAVPAGAAGRSRWPHRDLRPEPVFLFSMSTRPSDQPAPARAAQADGGCKLTRRWLRTRRRSQLGSCPVCHGRVRADDALGLVDRSVAHAECALVNWLGPGRLLRELQ